MEDQFVTFHVRAKFEYVAEDVGEASVNKGDLLEIVGENEFGWWLGQNRSGELGWVPSNYFERLSQEEYDEILRKVEEEQKEQEERMRMQNLEYEEKIRIQAEEIARARDPRLARERQLQQEIDEKNEILRLKALQEEAQDRALQKQLETIRIVDPEEPFEDMEASPTTHDGNTEETIEEQDDTFVPVLYPVQSDPTAEMVLSRSSMCHSVTVDCCVLCSKVIEGVKVKALGGVCHLNCYRCDECNVELADIGAFEHEGKCYCTEHYQLAVCEKCKGCNKPVFNRFIKALGSPWHRECFVCASCKKPFLGGQFHRHENQPYCKADFTALFAHKCQTCTQPITTGITIKVLGNFYHKDCFRCPVGDHVIDAGAPLKVVNGVVHCKEHSERVSKIDTCTYCDKLVKAGGYVVEGKRYHRSCLRCCNCDRILKDGQYIVENGHPMGNCCAEPQA